MNSRGRTRHQKLPGAGEARERLREKGQFWTPGWVAEAMVYYAIGNGSASVFDPAVGEGAFLRAAKAVAAAEGRLLALQGTEIDPEALNRARQEGLSPQDLASVRVADFFHFSDGISPQQGEIRLVVPERDQLSAIVANPPYIRHHRLSVEMKSRLKEYGRALMGTALDGRAGYHVYFLLRALTLLAPKGRLAFIMPADTAEGVFSASLWRWITSRYCLEAVVTFAPAATPFPGVDTNAIVLMITNAPPKPEFRWARCREPENSDLRCWAKSGFGDAGSTIEVHRRLLVEGLTSGLSRPPQAEHVGPVLADYARVMRGIAPGNTRFFFLTRRQAAEIGIPDAFLLRAIGRTRDLLGDANEVTQEMLDQLDSEGRPTYLFSPDGRQLDGFPDAVQKYLRQGDAAGIPLRALIGTRRPWWKMETRKPPAFLFAYLGRRNVRFIRNRAGVVPLTGFLCVYPRRDDHFFVEQLGQVLVDPRTVANLARVGKSYGDGAIKVEPRALERLPLSADVVHASGLPTLETAVQMSFAAE